MPTATETGTRPHVPQQPPDVIALTGTPGTGKTTISRLLEPPITVIEANTLAHETNAIEDEDATREALIVDEKTLNKEAHKHLPEPPTLIEGHLAHHCNPDAVLLLRCHPDELRDRLQPRGWSKAKIDENIMAETLDSLVPEIRHDDAWETDTTHTPPETVAQAIRSLFDGEQHEILQPLGTADWTDTLAGGSST